MAFQDRPFISYGSGRGF